MGIAGGQWKNAHRILRREERGYRWGKEREHVCLGGITVALRVAYLHGGRKVSEWVK